MAYKLFCVLEWPMIRRGLYKHFNKPIIWKPYNAWNPAVIVDVQTEHENGNEIADLQRFLLSTVTILYIKWCESQQTFWKRRLCGWKHLVSEKRQRRMARLVQAGRERESNRNNYMLLQLMSCSSRTHQFPLNSAEETKLSTSSLQSRKLVNTVCQADNMSTIWCKRLCQQFRLVFRIFPWHGLFPW